MHNTDKMTSGHFQVVVTPQCGQLVGRLVMLQVIQVSRGSAAEHVAEELLSRAGISCYLYRSAPS
jgi:hypothetical protein